MSNATALRQRHQDYLNNYKNQEKQVHELTGLLNQLNDEKDVQVTLFGEALTNIPTSNQLALITNTKNRQVTLTVDEVLKAVQTLAQQEKLVQAQVDVGQLLANELDIAEQVAKTAEQQSAKNQASDVVLYGFGRIGRILTRLLLEQMASDKGLQLKAIVVRPGADNDLEKRASLLERDSIHGHFQGAVVVDEQNNGIIINGRFIQVIYANDPSEIDYTAYGIEDALIIDNTGKWKDEAGLSKHLQAKGAKKVLLTAPAKGNIKNVVYGVNHESIGDDAVVSAASCTTNAITPTLKVLNDKYGVENGHVETIHSFTNDQNLIDNYHKSDRRGRSAVLNMVITSTGAAKAVGKALPELEGKLTGNAIRVPTPNVSLAILNLNLKTAPADVAELNQFLEQTAHSHQWQAQIDYSDSTEAVSTDFVGTKKVGIVDAQATIVTDNHATVYIWYDNEVGYSTQVLRVAAQMAGIHYKQIPA